MDTINIETLQGKYCMVYYAHMGGNIFLWLRTVHGLPTRKIYPHISPTCIHMYPRRSVYLLVPTGTDGRSKFQLPTLPANLPTNVPARVRLRVKINM